MPENSLTRDALRIWVGAEMARSAAAEAEARRDAIVGAKAIGAALGLSARTVMTYHGRRLIPTRKVSGRLVAKRADVALWLSRRGDPAPTGLRPRRTIVS